MREYLPTILFIFVLIAIAYKTYGIGEMEIFILMDIVWYLIIFAAIFWVVMWGVRHMKRLDEEKFSDSDEKKYAVCPFCKEDIKPEAIICKHCRSDLSIEKPIVVGEENESEV